MDRFRELKCLAGYLEPGDKTCYIMTVIETIGTYEVAVLNDCWVDKIVFLKLTGELYSTERGYKTNPWTIKAAKEMVERFLNVNEKDIIQHWNEEPLIKAGE